MLNIVDYKIVSGADIDELSEKVNYNIESGWQPFNSIYGSIYMVCQLMVKYETVKQRKLVDCFVADFASSSCADEVEEQCKKDNYETVYKKDSILKMVKYENPELL